MYILISERTQVLTAQNQIKECTTSQGMRPFYTKLTCKLFLCRLCFSNIGGVLSRSHAGPAAHGMRQVMTKTWCLLLWRWLLQNLKHLKWQANQELKSAYPSLFKQDRVGLSYVVTGCWQKAQKHHNVHLLGQCGYFRWSYGERWYNSRAYVHFNTYWRLQRHDDPRHQHLLKSLYYT